MFCVEFLNFLSSSPFALAAIRYDSCGTRHFPEFARAEARRVVRSLVGRSAENSLAKMGGMMGQGQTFRFMGALSVTIPKTLTTAALLEMVPQFVICTICHCIVTGVSDHFCTAYLHQIIE